MEKTEFLRKKIFNNKEEFLKTLNFWRFKSFKITFTNGCFDLLHLGHADYLAKASDFGNVMVVGLNSDISVKNIKGKSRPLNDQYSRAMIIASFSFVDAVVIFDEDTPYNLIDLIKPDILVKGNDYKPEDIVGFDIVKSNGGTVETVEFVEGYSTSNIEKKIIDNFLKNAEIGS
jgi:rfaE bifunctional protein nucleotidyltransferase chain/domain